MRISIRQRLLAVAMLAAITCAVSLGALVYMLSFSAEQRLDRAREALTSELAALRGDQATSSPSFLGMRGGVVQAPPIVPVIALDPGVAESLNRVAREAQRSGFNTMAIVEQGDKTTMVGVGPAITGGLAWVVYPMHAPRYAGTWRLLIYSLAAATMLLVATALVAVTSVTRGAGALRGSLAALAKDLSAPIPRPPVRELSEVADGIASLVLDLSRAQQDKERLGHELADRERLASLGRVAAGVAHEVRNPLASIKLRLDLASSDPAMIPRLSDELTSVSAEIDRLDRLVADLLVVAGRRSGPRIKTAVGPLTNARVELLRPWAETRGVAIEVKGDASSYLDADAVARALDNLVRNAVEASPPRATVNIEITSSADVARVRVLDRGKGVAPDRVNELFEPFFTTKSEGTGLGLALSRAIASAHEGTLKYERRSGTTCFELAFPSRPPPPASEPPPRISMTGEGAHA